LLLQDRQLGRLLGLQVVDGASRLSQQNGFLFNFLF
jgi:hypothetical protein